MNTTLRVSLVELMVALVILTVGLLGLAATGDSAARSLGRARRMSQAVERARVTVDSLRSRACSSRGTMRGGGTGDSWTLEPGADSIRFIRDSVRVDVIRRFAIEGVALCP